MSTPIRKSSLTHIHNNTGPDDSQKSSTAEKSNSKETKGKTQGKLQLSTSRPRQSDKVEEKTDNKEKRNDLSDSKPVTVSSDALTVTTQTQNPPINHNVITNGIIHNPPNPPDNTDEEMARFRDIEARFLREDSDFDFDSD